MKKKTGIILIILLLSFAIFVIVVSAQDRDRKSDKQIQNFMSPGMSGMMGRGLRGMGRPGGPGPMGMIHPKGMMMGLGRPGMIMGMADKLGLSEDQRDELNDMFTSHRKSMIRKNADLEIAKVELQKLLSQDKPDMNAVKEKIRDIANLEAEMKFSRIQVWMDAKDVLTQAQQKELKELMRKGPDPSMGRMRMRRGVLDNKSDQKGKPDVDD